MNHQPSNQEHPSMNGSTLEDLKVELQLKEAQYQWMKAQLTQMVKEIIGDDWYCDKYENKSNSIDSCKFCGQHRHQHVGLLQRERARKYGLEIEDE